MTGGATAPHLSPYDINEPTCQGCGSECLKAGVCCYCGRCQCCGEHADDCSCEVRAEDRFYDAQYQDWLELQDGVG
jgi:hypothetical protein